MRRLDDRTIAEGLGEVRAFIVARNEIARLPPTMDYHRRLGVDRFFVIDNGSSDGTLEYLLMRPDTHVFQTQASYAASGCGVAWLNELLETYGAGHWTLTIDADEWLCFPRCESAPLPRLCAHLDAVGAEALFCILLDMYPVGSIANAQYFPGLSLLDICPLFDPVGYRLLRVEEFPYFQMYGGARERIFSAFAANAPHPPTISKVALVKWRAGRRFLRGAHAMTPAPLSRVTGALLHFKFLHDFAERVRVEVARGEHYAGAAEYRGYAQALAGGDLVFEHAGSARWRGSQHLVDLGLMATTDEWTQAAAIAAGVSVTFARPAARR